ncbi:MAG: iron-sulfur cluster carrier protein ApbC [Deltaproteobacteria bacterium]|nr:iron-sulfur cluster carrier protein ApbC [Deltaproteobacteria bacterium]
MSSVTESAVLNALRQVKDPDLHRDIVELGFVKGLSIQAGQVKFTIELTTPACPVKDRLRDEAQRAVGAIPGVTGVDVTMTANTRGRSLEHQKMLPGVKNPIAVASGKGGVGKSTTAVNLALALRHSGATVGLLDADIYGPSVPIMLGINERPGMVGQRLLPVERYGLKVMSMGFLITENTPVVWRGPMVHNILHQFLTQVDWGELDYLVIDLPPGTGDAQLTLTQSAPLAGAVIVTTPQDVALADAVKGLAMFTKVNVPVLGIVENMSYFLCPHCNERSEIFGHGGGRRKADELQVPFLGEVPIVGAIREGGDNGRPVVVADPDSAVSKVYLEVAGALAARLSVMNVDGPAIYPGSPITWVSN